MKCIEAVEELFELVKDRKYYKDCHYRSVISRLYESLFLELFFYITEEKGYSYEQLKTIAKEHFKKENKKLPINKHTIVGAFLEINYGILGSMYQELRELRNRVDYKKDSITDIDEVVIKDYIKTAKIILDGVRNG